MEKLPIARYSQAEDGVYLRVNDGALRGFRKINRLVEVDLGDNGKLIGIQISQISQKGNFYGGYLSFLIRSLEIACRTNSNPIPRELIIGGE